MKALYSMMVMAALLVGCGGGEGAGHAGTYAMTMKMMGEEMQIRFELKSDNTFTALPYKDGNKEDEDPIAGDWKIAGDEIVLSGKDQGNDEEVGFRFNKDTLELTAMMVKGENQLDNLKEFMGDEAMKLKKL